MIATLRKLVPGRWLDTLREVEQLEMRVIILLADLWYRSQGGRMSDTHKSKRILLGLEERVSVTGTKAEIEAAARRMVRRTKSCVIVTVPVAIYHVRGCDDFPSGGYNEDGN
jgi:hypothetical protein